MAIIFDNPRWRFWTIAIVTFAAIIWLLKPMLLPFVAGLTIAYFLNPVVNKICALTKMPRWLGSISILTLFLLLVSFTLLLIAPVLQNQMTGFAQALPHYIDNIRATFIPWVEKWLTQLPSDQAEKLRDATAQYAGSVVESSGKILTSVLSSGAALVKTFTFIVITIVVAFYLLRDFTLLAETIDELLPRKNYKTIRNQLKEIDKTLSGFIRGQALVCLCLGSIYGIGLTIAGLDYGATIGLVGGILSFIPYVGSTFVCLTSLLLGFLQFDTIHQLWPIVIVFLVGQSLEGYFLTPKLVGDRVNLHPVWILFALFAGASLMGFLGVLIAVPVASIIGVMVRFSLRHYKISSIYRDPLDPRPKERLPKQ